MAASRMSALEVISRSDIALTGELWRQLISKSTPALIPALRRAAPPPEILDQITSSATADELSQPELEAAWPHLSAEGRVEVIRTGLTYHSERLASMVVTVAEVDAIFDRAVQPQRGAPTGRQIVQAVVAAEGLDATGRTRALTRLVDLVVSQWKVDVDDVLLDLLQHGNGIVTREDVAAALPPIDAHTLLWWRYAMVTDRDIDDIIDVTVRVGDDDNVSDTLRWAQRLGAATFEKFSAALRAELGRNPRPELVTGAEELDAIERGSDTETLTALAGAYLDGACTTAVLEERLADRSTGAVLDRKVADQVITDPRTGTELAVLAARRSRNATLDASHLLALRGDDLDFCADIASTSPNDTVAGELDRRGVLDVVAVKVIERWATTGHDPHESVWSTWVGHTDTRFGELSWDAAHAAAARSDEAAAQLADVYRRAPLLALELEGSYDGTVAGFAAMLDLSQTSTGRAEGRLADPHSPAPCTS